MLPTTKLGCLRRGRLVEDGRSPWSIGLGVAALWVLMTPIAWAESIAPAPDGTGTSITVNGSRIDIGGGSRSSDGANLFHSFQRFNLNANEIANFLATPDLRNILGQVVGGEPSQINGLIQVTGGSPNLFLINPAGIVFGPDARLNVPAAFTATTATGVSFGDGGDRWLNTVGANDYANLWGDPSGLSFALAQPAGILNRGMLAVPSGHSLNLIGGTVVSVGGLSVTNGRLTVAAVPGDRYVRFTPEGSVLAIDLPVAGRSGLEPGTSAIGPITARSIPELLAGQPVTANGLTVNPDGTVAISHSQGPLRQGDVAVQSAQAGTATLSAANNLILLASQLQTTGDLNLLAGNGAIGRDAPGQPLQATAGGQLTLWGDRAVDLYSLHDPTSRLSSQGNLFMVSSGAIAGDLPLQTNGQLFLTTPTGSPAAFRSTYQPVVSQVDNATVLGFSRDPVRSGRATFVFPSLIGTTTTTRPTITATTTTSTTTTTTRPTITTTQPITIQPTLSPTLTPTTTTTPTFTPLILVSPIQPSSPTTTTTSSPSFSTLPLFVSPATTTSSDSDDRDEDLPVLQGAVVTSPNEAVAGLNLSVSGVNLDVVGAGAFTAPTPEPGLAWSVKQAPASAPWSVNVNALVEVGLNLPQPPSGSPSGSAPASGLANASNGTPSLGGAPGSAPFPGFASPSSANVVPSSGSAPGSAPLPTTGTANVGGTINSSISSSAILQQARLSQTTLNNALPSSAALSGPANSGLVSPGAGLPVNPVPNPSLASPNPGLPSGSSPLSSFITGDAVAGDVAGVRVNQTDLVGRSSDMARNSQVTTDPGQVLDLQALRNQAKAAIATCDNTVWLDCQRKAITQARSTGDLSSLQRALYQLGHAHYQAGEYGDALKTYEEARLLAVGHNQPVLEAIAESELGNVYGALGQFAESTEHYQRALKLARSHQLPALESRVLNNLGLIAANQKDFAQAKTYQEQALAIARRQQDSSAQAWALTQLGLVHYQNTDYSAALAAQTEALTLAERSNNRPAMARILDNLGLVEYARENYQAAAAAQTRALALTQELGDRHAEARALSNLGDTQYQLKQFDQSIANLQGAIEAWERLRENLTNDGARLAIFETQETTYSTLQTVLLAAQQPERALEINERSRSQALLKLLAEESNWNDRPSVGGGSRPSAATNSVEPINIDRIRQVAREQSATLVSYSIEREVMDIDGQRQLTDLGVNIWVVQPSGSVQFRQVKLPNYQFLKDQLPLLRVFLSARQANRSGEAGAPADRSVVPGLRQLHDLLITPIADLLPTQGGDRLIVMPQQELFLVPFSALQDAQGRYLIEHYSLATAPSIQVLDRTFQQAQQLRDQGVKLGDRPLIVGNPTMPILPSRRSNNTRSQLAPLPNAEAEAVAVAQMLNTQPLTGDAATKAAVLDRIQQASVIHLATHGLLDSKRGLDSAIALAPASDGNDGWLTARELLNLDLNAQLVVLSACNTGQGALSGDGIVGLSRSLLAAGAPSAIVTQWAVPDAPTAALMTRFYEFLGQGLDKAAALRQATLATMQQYPDPIDWAAFTLIGDTH